MFNFFLKIIECKINVHFYFPILFDLLRVNNKSLGVSRYVTQKNRHNTPNRLELRKFCPYCFKHRIHGEVKK